MAWTIAAFTALAPLFTFLLLVIKGLPSFAAPHWPDVLLWVYQVTWLAAAVAGLLLSGILVAIRRKLSYFLSPYDFGRCFSLGAIAGATVEAASTWTYRRLSHHPFSSFWIAGAMMAGCLAGMVIVPAILGYLPDRRVRRT
ncbi:MAG TPA: hypothetical protein VMU17_02740 [Elusimicrobiota bacterium]|nr:hypothetical protein [Elusimicrobiota bacterium]